MNSFVFLGLFNLKFHVSSDNYMFRGQNEILRTAAQTKTAPHQQKPRLKAAQTNKTKINYQLHAEGYHPYYHGTTEGSHTT